MNRMTLFRAIVGIATGLCLIVGSSALAKEAHRHHHRHVHHAGLSFRHGEAVSFNALQGWKRDNLVAAFQAYLKSCDAIKNASKAARKARPFDGGLYNA